MTTLEAIQAHITAVYNRRIKPVLEFQACADIDCIINLDSNLKGSIQWQVREMQSPQEPKQKTLDQREESQEDQQEPRSSVHSSDQKLPRKEQKQRTARINRQYVISYPPGYTVTFDGDYVSHEEYATSIVERLQEGLDVVIPDTFKLTILESPDDDPY